MSKGVSLDRLRDISRQRSIRTSNPAPVPIDRDNDRGSDRIERVEWPIPS